MTTTNNATHGAQTAPFSFSAGATMTFKTHNETDININGTCLQGEVEATYAELCDLFGSHHDGDGYKVDAEWYVKFDDGTIATIYNWKNGKNYEGENGLSLEQIDNWHVGGDSAKAETQVQIALDLHREKAAEGKEQDPIEKAFEPAFDMMQSIRANKGEKYGMLVELALLVRKNQELLGALSATAVATEAMPESAAKVVGMMNAKVSAKIIAIAARLGDMEGHTSKSAEELMSWTDRLMEAEAAAAKNLFEELGEGDA